MPSAGFALSFVEPISGSLRSALPSFSKRSARGASLLLIGRAWFAEPADFSHHATGADQLIRAGLSVSPKGLPPASLPCGPPSHLVGEASHLKGASRVRQLVSLMGRARFAANRPLIPSCDGRLSEASLPAFSIPSARGAFYQLVGPVSPCSAGREDAETGLSNRRLLSLSPKSVINILLFWLPIIQRSMV